MADRRPYEKPTLTRISEDELIALLDRADLTGEPIPSTAQGCMREVVWLTSVLSILHRGGHVGLVAKVHRRIRTLEQNL